MHALRQWAERFWFAAAAPFDLGVSRALFYAILLIVCGRADFSGWGEVAPVFWMPMPVFSWLHIPLATPAVLVAMQAMWKASLLLSCVGLLTRLSTFIAFALGTYLLALGGNFGHVHHANPLIVVVLATLALSRCGDACSLDRLLSRLPPPAPSGEYTWPIRLTCVLLALVFFAAGTAKLRLAGPAWADPENLRLILMRSYYHFPTTDPWTPWGLWIAQKPWLCGLMGAGTLALEVGAPLALVDRRLRAIIVPGWFVMLIAFRALIGPTFMTLFACAPFWVPWHRWRPGTDGTARGLR